MFWEYYQRAGREEAVDEEGKGGSLEWKQCQVDDETEKVSSQVY